MFDADNFMAATVEGELSTEYVNVPENEYQAVAGDAKIREAKGSVMMDIPWTIDDPSVAEVTGRETNTVRQTIFLDITEQGGLDLAKGKNVQLGKLRQALGQNGPGAWSPSMISGNVAKVRVSHRMYEGTTYADIKGVAAL
jgi:hypothetical protein